MPAIKRKGRGHATNNNKTAKQARIEPTKALVPEKPAIETTDTISSVLLSLRDKSSGLSLSKDQLTCVGAEVFPTIRKYINMT